jgi:hypothetical protein
VGFFLILSPNNGHIRNFLALERQTIDEGHRAVVAGAVPPVIAGKKNDPDVLLRKRNRLLD